jgi:hypothetical protein
MLVDLVRFEYKKGIKTKQVKQGKIKSWKHIKIYSKAVLLANKSKGIEIRFGGREQTQMR